MRLFVSLRLRTPCRIPFRHGNMEETVAPGTWLPAGKELSGTEALHGSTDPASVDRRLASYCMTRKQRSLSPPFVLLAFGEQNKGRRVALYGAQL